MKTIHNKNDYQRSYLRIYRATEEQKETVSTLLHECLTLEFEAQYHLNRMSIREKTNKPLPINPDYKLPSNGVYANKTVITPNGNIETYLVTVSEKTDTFLIPFYRDLALEFFDKHKNSVTLIDTEAHTKNLQTLNFRQLESAKQRLIKIKRDAIFYRINQESRKAQEHFDGIVHKFSEEDVNTSQKIEAIWMSLMKKLNAEGYEYFPASLAANTLLRILTQNSSPLTDDSAIISHEIFYPAVNIDDNKSLYGWSVANKHDLTLEEYIYTKYRLEELAENRQFNEWQQGVVELMQFYRKYHYSKKDVIIELCKRGFDKKHIDRAIEIFEELPEIVLSSNLTLENQVSFET